MITAEGFELVDGLTRSHLERHPVWCPYDDSRDRPTILGWGVSETRLDRQLERVAYCGTQPLFPVLGTDGLPEGRSLLVAADFVTAAGNRLPGYLHRPHAFGVFAGGREFCFNDHLPAISARAAARLAAEIGEEELRLFPLRFEARARDGTGGPLDGEIERRF